MSRRTDLLEALKRHRPYNAHEENMLYRIRAFVDTYENCFERALLVGHITGSAWIVNPERTHTLLVHHARLDKWLQPGGHCDDDPSVLHVALREVEEETGLRATPVHENIFDVDAHDIPARKSEPAHIHYDIRYLFEAPRESKTVVSPESRDVRWVRLEKVSGLNTDESVLRLVAKTPRVYARTV